MELNAEKNFWVFIAISAGVHLAVILSNIHYAIPHIPAQLLEVNLIEIGKPNKPPGRVDTLPEEQPTPLTPPIFEKKEIIQPTYRQSLPQYQISQAVSYADYDGTAQKDESSVRGGGGTDEAILVYFMMIKQRIEVFKKYPQDALKRGEEGEVQLKFIVLSDGNVKDIAIIKSSGFSVLDEASMHLVKKTAPFLPPPGNRSFAVRVPINYEISR